LPTRDAVRSLDLPPIYMQVLSIYSFRLDEIQALARMIYRIEELIKFNLYKASPEKAMYILCSRLAYLTRYYYHMKNIGCSILWISEVFNSLIERIYHDWKDLIHWRLQLNDYNKLLRYKQHLRKARWGKGRV
jgi:hypothetical protein